MGAFLRFRLPRCDSLRQFRQSEAPRCPLAAPDGVGRDFAFPSQVQYPSARDAEELRRNDGVHKILDFAHGTHQ